MNRCLSCGCWDSDREGCTMPSTDMFYACPIEADKPENQKELAEMAEWYAKKGETEKEMIMTHNGEHFIVPDEVAEKIHKYDKIVEVLEKRSPYGGNRETCDEIRKIVNGG